jgi:hypothetical protein
MGSVGSVSKPLPTATVNAVRVAVAWPLFVLLACGSRTSLDVGDTGSPGAPAACNYAPGLATPAVPGECTAARTVASCPIHDVPGTTVWCLSDDPHVCAGNATNGHPDDNCQAACTADEYGVGCNPPRPFSDAGIPQPPPGCRRVPGFFCCPCL